MSTESSLIASLTTSLADDPPKDERQQEDLQSLHCSLLELTDASAVLIQSSSSELASSMVMEFAHLLAKSSLLVENAGRRTTTIQFAATASSSRTQAEQQGTTVANAKTASSFPMICQYQPGKDDSMETKLHSVEPQQWSHEALKKIQVRRFGTAKDFLRWMLEQGMDDHDDDDSDKSDDDAHMRDVRDTSFGDRTSQPPRVPHSSIILDGVDQFVELCAKEVDFDLPDDSAILIHLAGLALNAVSASEGTAPPPPSSLIMTTTSPIYKFDDRILQHWGIVPIRISPNTPNGKWEGGPPDERQKIESGWTATCGDKVVNYAVVVERGGIRRLLWRKGEKTQHMNNLNRNDAGSMI